ncbi:hypothetical protein HaLaN_30024 [Haematococcus lacustris]|uniref:Uncharacterized protein n=1 Tax=Haematococcus lacustris TaxID=44745 RepID=A0A6A0ADT2_HAELA|nr:hypothetical protein HaLaN_30024 [Haematococcus lacustris]
MPSIGMSATTCLADLRVGGNRYSPGQPRSAPRTTAELREELAGASAADASLSWCARPCGDAAVLQIFMMPTTPQSGWSATGVSLDVPG